MLNYSNNNTKHEAILGKKNSKQKYRVKQPLLYCLFKTRWILEIRWTAQRYQIHWQNVWYQTSIVWEPLPQPNRLKSKPRNTLEYWGVPYHHSQLTDHLNNVLRTQQYNKQYKLFKPMNYWNSNTRKHNYRFNIYY